MIDKIIDQLFLSGALDVYGEAATSKLRAHTITHVLTLSITPIPEQRQVDGVRYTFLQMADNLAQVLNFPRCADIIGTKVLGESIHLIHEAIQDGGNVLVHSEEGSSRAPTIVAAYLMQKFKWSAEKAITFVKMKRPTIGPNSSFVEQLNIFSTMHYHIAPRDIVCPQEYRTWRTRTSSRAMDSCGDSPLERTWSAPVTKKDNLPHVMITE